MKIEQLTASIGAELVGVNLADAAADEGLFKEVYAALLKHRVLFLRDQDDLTPQAHMAFASRMGQLEDHPMVPSHPDAPGLVQIYKTPDSPADRYENAWHSDGTWRATPPMGAVLRCVECPPVGGDTMWANMVMAYDKLPEEVKAQIADLWANHSFNSSFASAMPMEKRLAMRAQLSRTPSTRWCARDPETGEKAAVRERLRHALRQLPQQEERALRPGLQPGRGDLLQYLISTIEHPRIPGALALETQQRGDLGQPQHPALRGHGLRALPSQDGPRRHRGRQALLTPPCPFLTQSIT